MAISSLFHPGPSARTIRNSLPWVVYASSAGLCVRSDPLRSSLYWFGLYAAGTLS